MHPARAGGAFGEGGPGRRAHPRRGRAGNRRHLQKAVSGSFRQPSALLHRCRCTDSPGLSA
eukprot:10400206-Alexandrium_andersonii.AAC.1